MRVFVTGGSGFVGGRLIAALRERGDDVRALARSDRAAEKVRARGATPARGDLSDPDALRAEMEGCDVCFHAAAKVEQWGRPADFERANVQGTANVVAAARAAGVRRLVHVSTEAVLVGTPIVRATEAQPVPARPLGLYPRTKAAAERIVGEATGIEAVIVRPRFVWGAGDTTLLPAFVDAVRRGRFRWIDRGRYLTSTCHVDNVVEGLLLAAERGTPGAAYFLTDGEPVEFRDFLTRMLATRGVTPPDASLPRGLAHLVAAACEAAWRLLRLHGEPPVTRTALRLMGEEVTVDDARARRELGYTGRVSIEAGLAELARAA